MNKRQRKKQANKWKARLYEAGKVYGYSKREVNEQLTKIPGIAFPEVVLINRWYCEKAADLLWDYLLVKRSFCYVRNDNERPSS